jgi:hypothetical protein
VAKSRHPLRVRKARPAPVPSGWTRLPEKTNTFRASAFYWAFLVDEAFGQAARHAREERRKLEVAAANEAAYFAHEDPLHRPALGQWTPRLMCVILANGVPTIALVVRVGAWPEERLYSVKMALSTKGEVCVKCEFPADAAPLPIQIRDPRSADEARAKAAQFVSLAIRRLESFRTMV